MGLTQSKQPTCYLVSPAISQYLETLTIFHTKFTKGLETNSDGKHI